MKLTKKNILIGLGGMLVMAGVLILYFGFFGRQFPQEPKHIPTTTLEAAPTTPEAELVKVPQEIMGDGMPQYLDIADVSISIPISSGYYNSETKQWTLGNNAAYFATMTSKPNANNGNTFIYGHNRSSVFSRLPKMQVGSLASVTTSTNERYTYRLRGTYTTTPEDASVLHYRGAPILTLQTCSGAFFQNRTMYVFDLVEASHV